MSFVFLSSGRGELETFFPAFFFFFVHVTSFDKLPLRNGHGNLLQSPKRVFFFSFPVRDGHQVKGNNRCSTGLPPDKDIFCLFI